MIQASRFAWAALAQTWRWGGMAIRAARRGLPDERGGVYDQACFNWSQGLLRAARIAVEVEHSERLVDRPCVYVANHVSMIDIWALITRLPSVPRFLMKKELLKVPLFGRAAEAAGHIVIDRQARAAAFGSYERAAEVIRRGRSACVFVEGTRSRSGKLMPFKKGPFVLAVAARVPVVPIYVAGAFELMPRLAPYPHPGTVTLRVGEAIPTVGLTYADRDQLSHLARQAMVGLGAEAEAPD